MTVTVQTPFTEYTAAPGATVFATSFRLITALDLQVQKNNVIITGGFTVTGTGQSATATVTFTTPMVGGENIKLRRVVALARENNYQFEGDFQANVVNEDFDRLWMSQQEQELQINENEAAASLTNLRNLRAPIGEVLSEMPNAAARANKIQAFDSTGLNPIYVLPGTGTASDVLIDLANKTNPTLGAGLVGFFRNIAGFFGRTVSDKLAENLSVADFRQLGDVDDSLSFQRACNALLTLGGSILVPPRTTAYVLTTKPNWGTKSIQWNIDVAAKFTGSATVGDGSFPRAVTNISMLPVGRFIQSQSNTLSTFANATAVDVIDVLQPVGMNGGSVGQYVGIKGNNSGSNTNLWATNFLVESGPASTGGVFGCEIDVNCYSAAALHFGLDITGIGTQNPDFGLIIQRADTTIWDVGIEIRKSNIGINMTGTNMSRGIAINSPTILASLISAKQISNGDRGIYLQRNTDTAPAGLMIQMTNAANSVELFSVDVLGNILSNGALILRGTPNATFANAISLGGDSINTAGTGITTVPAQCRTFIKAWLGGVEGRIPFYNI